MLYSLLYFAGLGFCPNEGCVRYILSNWMFAGYLRKLGKLIYYLGSIITILVVILVG